MINFNYAQNLRPFRLAIGECVEARTQYQVLIRTARDRFSQAVLGKAAAEHKVRPDAPHAGLHKTRGVGPDCSLARLREKSDADGVKKNLRLAIEDLMCGAQRSDTHSRLTRGPGLIHCSHSRLSTPTD